MSVVRIWSDKVSAGASNSLVRSFGARQGLWNVLKASKMLGSIGFHFGGQSWVSFLNKHKHIQGPICIYPYQGFVRRGVTWGLVFFLLFPTIKILDKFLEICTYIAILWWNFEKKSKSWNFLKIHFKHNFRRIRPRKLVFLIFSMIKIGRF